LAAAGDCVADTQLHDLDGDGPIRVRDARRYLLAWDNPRCIPTLAMQTQIT
jgi:hypothetical protein